AMPARPWWMARVLQVLSPSALSPLGLGALWQLHQQLEHVRENTELHLLQEDFRAVPDAPALWACFEARETAVRNAVHEAAAEMARRVREGELSPELFRTAWERLGFSPHAVGAGTPADDFLDGLLHLSRLTLGEASPACGMPNMASRAERL